ncbi:hypothetical protein ACJ5H2_05870 [Nocardioides sp. R1-1]|uniref:hypothetical protein n=1 Tax=Nocardioides sp. R1-1 TaxID=3383502 RepID=UPI0038CFEE3E
MRAVRMALAALLIVAASVVSGVLDAPADARPVVEWTTCPSERGEHAHCVWDGRHMGDRRGPSFVTYTTWEGGQFVIRRDRIPHRVAHKLVRRILCAEHDWRCAR